jgi:hypothetical protein
MTKRLNQPDNEENPDESLMEEVTIPPKGKGSALVMAGAFVLALLIGRGAISIVRYLTGTLALGDTGNITSGAGSSAMTSAFMPVVAILGLILMVGFALVMFSLWIRKQDDSHFGSRGAVRWALSGIIFAVLVEPAIMFIPRPGAAGSAWLGGLYQVLRVLWSVVAFQLARHLVFKWLPLPQGPQVPQSGGSMEQIASSGLPGRGLVKPRSILAIMRQNPDARRGFQAISWFLIGGGILILTVGLTTPGHPNRYLLPAIIVMGFACTVTGVAGLCYLRQSRIAQGLMLLSCILLAIFLYLLVQSFG